jgi:type I restriction enzyme S subunit
MPGVDGQWLAFVTRSQRFRSLIQAAATGTSNSMKNVSQEAVRNIPRLVPPCAEQRQIADILSSWGESLCREQSLRTHLSSLYRGLADRFLQIRGEGMHRLSRLLIPERMAAVTPDGPFRALGVRSHGKGTFSRIDALAAVEEFGKTVYRVEPNRFIVNIVFAWEGAAAITSEADSGCLVSHRFPTFRINEQLLDIEYFRHVIRTKPFRQLLALASPGGAGRNKTLNRDDLLKFKIYVPSLSEQTAIAETLNSLDRRISVLDRHISELSRQRDALGTQLLTGRLRVPETQTTSCTRRPSMSSGRSAPKS